MMNRTRAVLLALTALFQGAAPGDEAAAERLLAEAGEKVAKHAYDEALRLYAKLAKEHAGTEAGAVGARRSSANALLGWLPLGRSAPSANRVELVVTGDGYTAKYLEALAKNAADVPKMLAHSNVLEEYASYFAFTFAPVVSREDGVDAHGRAFDTAFEARDTGKLEHDVDVDRARVEALLAEIPDWMGLAIVLVRLGERGTGSAGTVAVGERDPVSLLRAFGSAFAGLGDELTSDQGVFSPIGEHPNISASNDPASVPWAHWIERGVPGIGLYPGGLGRATGVWKPVSTDCAMNDEESYCPVCREAIVLAIHRYVDPIESVAPPAHELSTSPEGDLGAARKLEFEVTVMTPASHALEVAWYVVPERGVPRAAKPNPGALADRRARGPLPKFAVEPRATSKPDRKGVARFELDASLLEAGRHRVVCRVADRTLVKGEKWPWVLADRDGLLESERGWWISAE